MRIAAVLVASAVALLATASASAARPDDAIPGRFILVYQGSGFQPGGKTTGLERREGFRADHRYAHALKGFAAKLSPGQRKHVEDDPAVALVTPDRAVHAASTVPVASGETVPTGARRIEADTTTRVRDASSANAA